jgi:ribosomal protein L29
MQKKTDQELAKLLLDTRASLHEVRFAAAGARAKDPDASRKLKKVVARVLTEQRSRELAK